MFLKYSFVPACRQALRVCDKSNSTLGRILSATIRYRHVSAADMSAIAGDIASRDLKRRLQRAYPLAIVATLSPLLGLLGTVIGIILEEEVSELLIEWKLADTQAGRAKEASNAS